MNTGFKITNAGLVSASTANPTGPFINVAQFKIGNGVNYVPLGTETALRGTVLYTGVPSSFSIVDGDTIECLLVMDITVGPFLFGEIGIFLSDGTLFAISTFDVLQEKIRAVGNQAGTRWVIRARLKLAQLPAVCTVTVTNTSKLLELPSWASLLGPLDNIQGANAAIIHEPNGSSGSRLVIRDTDYHWAVEGYQTILITQSNSPGLSSTSTTITSSEFPGLGMNLPSSNSRYLVQFSNGTIRKIVSIAGDTITFSPPNLSPRVGTIRIAEDCCESVNIKFADTLEYNKLAVDFNPYWATPTGSYPASNKGLNETSIPLLTRSPTISDWNLLINSIRKASKIHGVPTSDLVNTNFIYPGQQIGAGLASIITNWTNLVAKVPLLQANRNIFDPLYQSTTLTPSVATRTSFWTGSISHGAGFSFPDKASLEGALNAGFSFRLSGVASGTLPIYIDLTSFFGALSTIVVGRGATGVSNNSQLPVNSGLYTAGVGVTTNPPIFSKTVGFAGGRAISVNLYLVRETDSAFGLFWSIQQTGYTNSYYAGSGNLTTTISMTKADSSILDFPVQPFPVITPRTLLT